MPSKTTTYQPSYVYQWLVTVPGVTGNVERSTTGEELPPSKPYTVSRVDDTSNGSASAVALPETVSAATPGLPEPHAMLVTASRTARPAAIQGRSKSEFETVIPARILLRR
jgi:hypothetical protein